jgi:hypothetical protein
MLGHDLEESGLHLGWSAIDFISQNDVGKDWTPLNIEGLL